MRKVKLTKESTKDILDNLLKRSPNNYTEYADTVQEIVDNVKSNGDKALFDYTKKFDKAEINSQNIKVTDAEIEEAQRGGCSSGRSYTESVKKYSHLSRKTETVQLV